VDSGVERSLEHTAYARRRAELEQALARLGADRSTQLGPADVDRLNGLEQRRVRHVVTENDRVLAAADALRSGDLAAVGRLLSESHASLRDDYEVSVPELDLLVELADDAGAYGARLLGAGFGGAVLILTDEERAEPLAARVASAHAERTGRRTEPLVVRASAGAGLLAA
jgi:galactokinase